MLPKSFSKNCLPNVQLVLINIPYVLFRELQRMPPMQGYKHSKIRGQEKIKTQDKSC